MAQVTKCNPYENATGTLLTLKEPVLKVPRQIDSNDHAGCPPSHFPSSWAGRLTRAAGRTHRNLEKQEAKL